MKWALDLKTLLCFPRNSHITFICDLLWQFEDGRWFSHTQDCLTALGKLFRVNHDDVIKWKHFPCYWPLVQGIHWSSVNSPHKGRWHRALMFCLICAWINGWINNREAGDLRRHGAHYDFTVIPYVATVRWAVHPRNYAHASHFLVFCCG